MKKTKEEILSQHLHEVENGVHSCQDEVCDVVEEIKAAMEEYATQCQQDNAERNKLIEDLLRFCETDGTVSNGFRTKEIILKLITTLNKH